MILSEPEAGIGNREAYIKIVSQELDKAADNYIN